MSPTPQSSAKETASASELESVAHVTNQLQDLLRYARTVKPETTVEPSLNTSDFVAGVDALHEHFTDDFEQTYRFLTVETAARQLFYSLINSLKIEDPGFVEVWDLLDIVLLCGDRGKCTPELVCWLLEELLDSQTTHGCRIVFDYLESRREKLAHRDFHKKNLVFLRSCNELLRRLSRAEDAIFCGRVFFFLFQTFPLGDKSSVNLRGEFHVENTTIFDASEPTANREGRSSDQMEVDTKTTDPPPKESTPQPSAVVTRAGSRAVPIKAPPKKTPEEEILSTSELYPIFWRLQHDFSDPTRLYNTENLSGFKKGLASTLVKFRNTETVVQTKAGDDDKRGTKRKWDEDGTAGETGDHLADTYNPKYLTSRDLFDLELSDLAFQRHILVQALILIDFLLSLTDKARKKLADVAQPNKSLVYNFTLSDEDVKWATSTRSAITAYLSASMEGRQYCRMVETVLARDRNWVRWKVESCPSIVLPSVSTEQEVVAKKDAREATRSRRMPDKPMNGMDLSFLDEGSGGGLESLKDPGRFTVPSIEDLVNGIKTDQLDVDMAMDDDEKTGLENAIANKKWRALREARSLNLGILDKVNSEKDLEEMVALTNHGEAGGSAGDDANGLTEAVVAENSSTHDAEGVTAAVEG